VYSPVVPWHPVTYAVPPLPYSSVSGEFPPHHGDRPQLGIFIVATINIPNRGRSPTTLHDGVQSEMAW